MAWFEPTEQQCCDLETLEASYQTKKASMTTNAPENSLPTKSDYEDLDARAAAIQAKVAEIVANSQ